MSERLYTQTELDAATEELRKEIEAWNNSFHVANKERLEQKARAESAEQQVLVLRKALVEYMLGHFPEWWLSDAPSELAEKALSTSAEIASGYVSIEDVRPLLDRWCELKRHNERCGSMVDNKIVEAFLAKHGDKFNK